MTRSLAAFSSMKYDPAHCLPDFLSWAIIRHTAEGGYGKSAVYASENGIFPVLTAGFFICWENPARSCVGIAGNCFFFEESGRGACNA